LIVDDDARQAGLMATLLESLGWQTCVAHSANEAVGLIRDNPKGVDALLLDFWMPVTNGWELSRELTAIDSRFADKVIFVTAGKESTILQMRSHLRAPVLAKPIDPEELTRELRRITGSAQALPVRDPVVIFKKRKQSAVPPMDDPAEREARSRS
jgi:two-component system, cell cycle sensor histidine kinase and response regulator CckA